MCGWVGAGREASRPSPAALFPRTRRPDPVPFFPSVLAAV
ncbi:IX [Ovine adenovirus 8]|uniref:IX n=1 Tax=Ovine adenovirus 8 TaxID=2601527 RepID=A0A5B8MAT9_9ADEN|nr:IX [Ovine adenovirus 8]QDZ17457.1 IX [Ovine adenovirus 8]